MAHELRTRARSSGRAAVERRTAFIGPTSPASEKVPPRMWCTVNHLGMMTYSGRPEADVRTKTVVVMLICPLHAAVKSSACSCIMLRSVVLACAATAALAGNPTAVFETSMGSFSAELYLDRVPRTASNFIDLAKTGCVHTSIHVHA